MPAPIADALAALRRGEMVVVVDDPDREDEGDFVMAAERATPAAVNHMITHGRGLLCLPMEGSRLDALDVPDMTAGGPAAETAFTVSIDLDEPGSTGISAADRARCIRRAVDPAARPGDFRRPGHVFPLRARPGGVLERRGHTEAAVDLARLAGFAPAGVICEILAEDGSMARGAQLAAIARRHRMPLISVADLVAHRRAAAAPVRRLAAADLPTPFGTFRAVAYRGSAGAEHVALVRGEPARVAAPLVRVHSECATGDLFASLRCDCGLQLRAALRRIAEEGTGVLVYLRGHEGRGIGLPAKLAAYVLQDAGRDTVQANLDLGLPVDARDYGDAAGILLDLGLPAVRLLTNNPAKTAGLRTGGVEAHAVPLRTAPTAHNVRYLRTKRDVLGHDLAEPDSVPAG